VSTQRRVGAGRLQPRGRLELPEYPLDAAWSGDGRALAVGLADGALVLLDVEEIKVDAGESAPGLPQPRCLPGHDGAVLAVAWQKAGRVFASSGEDGKVLLWDARALTSRVALQGAQWSEQLAFADNGRWLAAASGRTLSLIDDQGELRHRYPAQAGTIMALAWRPKSGELAAAGNGGVRLYRPPPQPEARAGADAQREPAARDLAIRGACLSAAFNSDGRLLAAGLQEGAVQLWNLATGSQSQMDGYGARVFATEWSTNGRYLATAAGSTLAIWDFSGKGPEGTRPLTYQGHSERITAMRFRPNGTWLVSAARDRRLLLWRVGGGDTPQDAHLLADECSLLRFSRDGARLAVGDARGGLTIFDCA
jgi:WD40 repeat protein